MWLWTEAQEEVKCDARTNIHVTSLPPADKLSQAQSTYARIFLNNQHHQYLFITSSSENISPTPGVCLAVIWLNTQNNTKKQQKNKTKNTVDQKVQKRKKKKNQWCYKYYQTLMMCYIICCDVTDTLALKQSASVSWFQVFYIYLTLHKHCVVKVLREIAVMFST